MTHITIKNKDIFFFLIIFLQIMGYYKMNVCDNIERPLLKGDNCISRCTTEEIKTKICKIDNDIIPTQWLNNIIYLGYQNYSYINLITTENNNLFFLSSQYPKSNSRLFYLLNYKGLSFYDEPIQLIEINDHNTKGRFQSEIFTIKLYNINDYKEYLISISIADQYVEIYNFYEGEIFFDTIATVFGALPNVFTFI